MNFLTIIVLLITLWALRDLLTFNKSDLKEAELNQIDLRFGKDDQL